MSAPNIVTISNIFGRTAISYPGNTNPYFMLSNPIGSNHVYKIDSITLCNSNGYNAVAANVWVNDANSASNVALVYSISVPALTTLIAMDKATSFYLEEGRSLVIQSAVANGLSFIVSYISKK